MSEAASIEITITDANAPVVSGNILLGVGAATAKTSLVTGSQKVHVMSKSGSVNVVW